MKIIRKGKKARSQQIKNIKKSANKRNKKSTTKKFQKLQPQRATLLNLVQNLPPHSFADKTVDSILQKNLEMYQFF